MKLIITKEYRKLLNLGKRMAYVWIKCTDCGQVARLFIQKNPLRGKE